jgi:protein-disulfide isomerase
MRPFYYGLGAIALVGAAVLGYVSTRPKPAPVTLDSTVALPKAEGYVLGDTNAPLQVIEFADMQCPVCADFGLLTEPDVKKRLIETGRISYRFMDFPLEMHPNAWNAANAGACANEQGKFWEIKDKIFEGQLEWSNERNPRSSFEKYAKAVGIDTDAWRSCYDSRRMIPKIQASQQEGVRRFVNATPTFIIGRRLYPGNIPYDRFKALVDSAIAELPAGATKAGATKAGATKADTARR